jgi:Tfp pilus assembly protein PilN
MIRVNLAGIPRKKAGKKAKKAAGGGGSNLLPAVHLLIMIGTLAGGYYFYRTLSEQSAQLDAQIKVKEDEQKKLEAFIKENQKFEARKAELAKRIKVIDDLRNSQLSPVVMLDQLATAIDRTRFVWLTNFTQQNQKLTMNGNANSLEALTQFYSNLDNSGYFHSIDLQKFSDDKGNYTFSMNTEFAPPAPPKPVADPAPAPDKKPAADKKKGAN